MGLDEKLREAAGEIRKRDDFVVVYHYDADGISAGAIACTALERLGKRFGSIGVKQLYSETIEEIKGKGKNYVFVDFGSGLIPLLKESFGKNFFVLDHHQAKGGEYRFHLNAFLLGLDGGDEISGAGMAYLFAKAIDEKNVDLSPLAVVGAVGDMQDFREGKLKGKNKEIVDEAVKAGVLKRETDLRLYGRITRPLIQFLEFSSSPIIPGLTANREGCVEFLKELGIEVKEGEIWRSYSDLSKDEKKKLSTALIVRLHSAGTPEWKIRELVGEVYTLVKEEPKTSLRDAKEYATLLNSCGRHGEAEVALAVCMGDRDEKYARAMALLIEHRRQLSEGIRMMREQGVEERENFYLFDAENEIKDSIVGIVAGMLYGSGAIEGKKPIIALARHEDGSVKVSGRATSGLVRKGVNLGGVFGSVCSGLGEGCEGGGHKIAAGCKVPAAMIDTFLEKVDKEIGKVYT